MTEARAQLSDVVSQVAFGGEPVVLTRHGKALVALVPAALLAKLTETDAEGAPVVLDLASQPDGQQGGYTIAAQHRGV